MKLFMCMNVLVLALLGTISVAEARGGGYGSHFHGRGWHGGSVPHYHNHGYHGYYPNNYYYGRGWGGYGWSGINLWPGYYTGGPVGYYNTPVRCYYKVICKHKNQCHRQKICRR